MSQGSASCALADLIWRNMATNQHTLLRQWHMLRLIPRHPRAITVREICSYLEREEFAVSIRTVQRDLNELSEVFPLLPDYSEKPHRWSWQPDAPNFDLPGLAVPEALTFKLVEQHLRHHLPPAALDALHPHFLTAEKALSNATGKQHSKAWLDKVRTVSQVQPLLPPAMDETCQRTVYDALMQDCQLTLKYRKRDGSVSLYEAVHPLAVVQRGQLLYLVCTFGEYEDVRTLALHRIVEADKRYEPARRQPGFSIDRFIESGQMGVRTGDPITLKAVFTGGAGEHLFETPISKTQALATLEDGSLQLTATVQHTRELVWWLLGFGANVTVLAPADLRREMKETTRHMAALYG